MSLKDLEHGIVNKTIAAIRTKPKKESSLADEALLGMVVKLLNTEEKGWYYIETHYKYRGYLHKNDLIIDKDRAAIWRSEAKHFAAHSIVDVMKEPNYQNYTIGLLVRGAIIQITENREKDWREIVLPSLKKGWIKEKYIQKKTIPNLIMEEVAIRESIIKTASSYLGTQYRWGGKSPLGIDCSGLCSIVYMLNGIIIWRDAELKDDCMREIQRKEMKKGDLLFYKEHVAMYMGDDKVIHSTSSKSQVVINSLNKNDENYDEFLDKNIISIGTVFYK